MEFQDAMKKLSERVIKYKDQITTEEATKTALIMPFFDTLGFDTRNPFEFVPEFTADVGLKKGEKVDYAILIEDKPVVLIEAKSCTEMLDKHDSQLIRYFHTTQAKIAILTNGVIYKFFTDLEETNKMDLKPFLEIDLSSLKDSEITELKKFFKSNFDVANILSTAEELKYLSAIKRQFISQIEQPSEQFIDYFLSTTYEGKKTKSIKDKFTPIVKKAVLEVINDTVRNKLESVLSSKEKSESIMPVKEVVEELPLIVTTEEETMAYYIVKSICAEFINPDRVSYKDTTNYFNIIIDSKVTKWITRLYLNSKAKYISFPSSSPDLREDKILIEKIEDIYQYRTRIAEEIKKYLD